MKDEDPYYDAVEKLYRALKKMLIITFVITAIVLALVFTGVIR